MVKIKIELVVCAILLNSIFIESLLITRCILLSSSKFINPTLFLSDAYQTLSLETVIGLMLILSVKIVSILTDVNILLCTTLLDLQEKSKIESTTQSIFFINKEDLKANIHILNC